MKTLVVIALAGILAPPAVSQTQNPALIASVSGEYRIALAKTTIHLSEWHEQSFWTQYQEYMTKDLEVSTSLYSSIAALGTADRNLDPDMPSGEARKMINDRYRQLALWQKYFNEISAAHNGVIALKFLQTEVLLDMLESARVYEQTPLKKFRYHPMEDSSTRLPLEKRTTLAAALELSKDEENPFFTEYTLYEHECDDLLGSDYSLIAAYAGEPSDYTPARAKLIGYNMLEVIRREIKLKENYLSRMNAIVGPSIASRFLAWEDYYSIVSKMDAWADAP